MTDINTVYYGETDSTQRAARDLASGGAAHGTLVIADGQTAGRGRGGKPFHSPPSSGLYMSLLLHADKLPLSNPTILTACAAVAVCEEIERLCQISPSIKWVNDVLVHGKKVCGILVEAVADRGTIRYFTVGIGVNLYTAPGGFPHEIKDKAGSLYGEGDFAQTVKSTSLRDELAKGITQILLTYNLNDPAALFAQYRARLCMLNREIMVTGKGEPYRAFALDIDEEGRLMVLKGDCSQERLTSGEVTILC
jgi:BirA family biotin operon repressor/biotin-[acetyl-CoA-carboxylase] ligase